MLEENKVELSKLLLWYGQDFGENNLEIITWIQKGETHFLKNRQISIKCFLKLLIEIQITEDF